MAAKRFHLYSFLATELLRVPGLWALEMICKNIFMTRFSNYKSGTYGKNSARTEGRRVEHGRHPFPQSVLLPREDFCSLLIALSGIVWTQGHIQTYSHVLFLTWVILFFTKSRNDEDSGRVQYSIIRSRATVSRERYTSVLVPRDL